MDNKEKEVKEIAFGKRLVFIKDKNDYVTNLINGRYFLTRYNMMIEQIQTGKIVEVIDGCPKTKEFLFAEAVLMKSRALKSHSLAYHGKNDLMKDHGLTEEDMSAIESDLYDGKIIRETYDDNEKKKSKAEFVKEE